MSKIYPMSIGQPRSARWYELEEIVWKKRDDVIYPDAPRETSEKKKKPLIPRGLSPTEERALSEIRRVKAGWYREIFRGDCTATANCSTIRKRLEIGGLIRAERRLRIYTEKELAKLPSRFPSKISMWWVEAI